MHMQVMEEVYAIVQLYIIGMEVQQKRNVQRRAGYTVHLIINGHLLLLAPTRTACSMWVWPGMSTTTTRTASMVCVQSYI